MAEKNVKQSDAASDTKSVQKQIDAEQERGYIGREVDPTPRENYTLQGAAAGKPTPETDANAAAAARTALSE